MGLVDILRLGFSQGQRKSDLKFDYDSYISLTQEYLTRYPNADFSKQDREMERLKLQLDSIKIPKGPCSFISYLFGRIYANLRREFVLGRY